MQQSQYRSWIIGIGLVVSVVCVGSTAVARPAPDGGEAVLADRVASLEARLAALEGAAPVAAPKGKRGKAKPKVEKAPTIDPDSAFRQKVLNALESELETLSSVASKQKILATLVSNKASKQALATHVETFNNHTHTFKKASHGWANKKTIEDCDSCLLPYVPQPSNGGMSTIEVSTPKTD